MPWPTPAKETGVYPYQVGTMIELPRGFTSTIAQSAEFFLWHQRSHTDGVRHQP
jgi:hypothetical protein